jgi:hypothetical protein
LESQYYQVATKIKVSYAIQYLALILFLMILTIESHDALSFVRATF